jgi:hypothetical protein
MSKKDRLNVSLFYDEVWNNNKENSSSKMAAKTKINVEQSLSKG